MRSAIPLLILLSLLSGSRALAQANLEIPQRGSVQSGVSIVSGWVCDADRVEVAFDGGDLIETAYGTTRQDTVATCGDDDNGFSLLWAYQLLGPGKHEVVAYADGTEFGRNTFSVTDISGGTFLRDLVADTRVQGFPDLQHDVVLAWQEANQNFVIRSFLESMDSYDTPGVWDASDALGNETLISWHLQPDAEDPTTAMMFALSFDITLVGDSIRLEDPVILAGIIKQDLAILMTDPEVGSDYSAMYTLLFNGTRSGMMELSDCEPVSLCPHAIGKMWQLEKGFPFEESPLTASVEDGTRTTVYDRAEQLFRSNRDRLRTVLEELLLEQESNPIRPGG